MLNSTVLEVMVGLVFCWASAALIASSIYEALASLVKLRSRSLLNGVKDLLNDQDFTGLAKDLYNNALINPRDSGKAGSEAELQAKPSYIDPKAFAVALLDAVQEIPGTFVELGAKIDKIADPQIKKLLKGIYARADGKLENMHAALSGWFDTSMQRVSGAYKRNAQLFTFLIALIVAGALNIDTFRVFHTVWGHPTLVAHLTAPATPTAPGALEAVEKLPVGWFPSSRMSIWVAVGWLVTACSALFGAPFWFDLLQRLVNLRGTGPKPTGSSS
jgi:hypothetical protein